MTSLKAYGMMRGLFYGFNLMPSKKQLVDTLHLFSNLRSDDLPSFTQQAVKISFWLSGACYRLKLGHATYFRAFTILLRALSKDSLNRGNEEMKLSYLAALRLANKLENDDIELVFFSEVEKKRALEEAESEVLKRLDYALYEVESVYDYYLRTLYPSLTIEQHDLLTKHLMVIAANPIFSRFSYECILHALYFCLFNQLPPNIAINSPIATYQYCKKLIAHTVIELSLNHVVLIESEDEVSPFSEWARNPSHLDEDKLQDIFLETSHLFHSKRNLQTALPELLKTKLREVDEAFFTYLSLLPETYFSKDVLRALRRTEVQDEIKAWLDSPFRPDARRKFLSLNQRTLPLMLTSYASINQRFTMFPQKPLKRKHAQLEEEEVEEVRGNMP